MFKIAVIDDHRILLDGIVGLIRRMEHIKEVDTFYRIEEFLEQLSNNNSYDLIITDIQMPGMSGLDLINHLRFKLPQQKVMVMSMVNNPELIYSLLDLDISGYFLKGNDAGELANGIHKVLFNEEFFSKEIQPYVNEYRSGKQHSILSKRELEIALQISKGKTGKEIGDELNLSHFTVQTHRKNIFRKLEIHNTAELVQLLNEKDLI